MLPTIDLMDHWGLTPTLTLTLTIKDASYHWILSLNHSLLLPHLSLPFSELQPKEAKKRAHVPILLYRYASARTVCKIESDIVVLSGGSFLCLNWYQPMNSMSIHRCSLWGLLPLWWWQGWSPVQSEWYQSLPIPTWRPSAWSCVPAWQDDRHIIRCIWGAAFKRGQRTLWVSTV